MNLASMTQFSTTDPLPLTLGRKVEKAPTAAVPTDRYLGFRDGCDLYEAPDGKMRAVSDVEPHPQNDLMDVYAEMLKAPMVWETPPSGVRTGRVTYGQGAVALATSASLTNAEKLARAKRALYSALYGAKQSLEF